MSYTTKEELSSLREVEERVKNEKSVPAGYIEIDLSTKGEFGAPASFHIRNMTTAELLDLASTDTSDQAAYIVELLQKLIWEKDCIVADFHEKEVIETLLRLYMNFYSTVWTGLPWTVTDEDKEFIEQQCGGKTEEYYDKMKALDTGKWKPTFDLDLSSLQFYDVDKAEGPIAEVKRKDFICEFTYPKFGDTNFLKKFITEKYKQEDAKHAMTRESIIKRNQQNEDYDAGKRLRPSSIYVPPTEEEAYKKYEKEKIVFSAKALLALSLKSINGKDLSKMPLSEKIQYVDDPQLDHTAFGPIIEVYKNIKIGINDTFIVKDPITLKPAETTFPFRIFDILQAMSDHRSNTTDIIFKRKN